MPPTNGFGVGTNHLGVNLAFTKFLFVSPREDDDGAPARLRQAGACIARGFSNDFDAESHHDAPPHETIQFFVAACPGGARDGHGIATARYAAQVCSKYRPRLDDVEAELRRRLGPADQVSALDGAIRVPQYTSAEMYAYAYKPAKARATGRTARNAIIIPVRKNADWWAMSALDRHSYFYPSRGGQGPAAQGHARAAAAGITTIYRQVYHHPDGPAVDGQFDFVSYFDAVCRNLRDVEQNPEWKYVEEGPEWRGWRVLRW